MALDCNQGGGDGGGREATEAEEADRLASDLGIPPGRESRVATSCKRVQHFPIKGMITTYAIMIVILIS